MRKIKIEKETFVNGLKFINCNNNKYIIDFLKLPIDIILLFCNYDIIKETKKYMFTDEDELRPSIREHYKEYSSNNENNEIEIDYEDIITISNFYNSKYKSREEIYKLPIDFIKIFVDCGFIEWDYFGNFVLEDDLKNDYVSKEFIKEFFENNRYIYLNNLKLIDFEIIEELAEENRFIDDDWEYISWDITSPDCIPEEFIIKYKNKLCPIETIETLLDIIDDYEIEGETYLDGYKKYIKRLTLLKELYPEIKEIITNYKYID